MRIYLQWARANPQGWEPLDVTRSQDIRGLPNGGEPTRAFDPVLDGDTPKWLVGVNVQGVVFTGYDHIGPSIGADGRILIHAWNDDPVDWPPGTRHAVTWSFANPRIDPRYGEHNTEQYLTVYDEQGRTGHIGTATSGGPITYLPWSAFVPPGPANLVRHGIWMDAALWDLHLQRMAETRHDWREWIIP